MRPTAKARAGVLLSAGHSKQCLLCPDVVPFYPRSSVLSPGSEEPRRARWGPVAMGHPPWGSSMGFMYR